MSKLYLITAIACLWLAGHAQPPAYIPLGKPAAGGYFASAPEAPVQGLVLFIPRPGQDPSEVFPDSSVTSLIHAKGWAMAAVSHPGSFLLTPQLHRYFLEVIRHASARFGTEPERIAIGGLAEGGVLALQFAEECGAAPSLFPFRPRAVFCIDSPVDLAGWWMSCERDISRNASPEAMAEASFALRGLTAELGGAPDTLAHVYAKRSPFSMTAQSPGKERFLMETAVNLYYSSDLMFQIQERKRTIHDLPAGPGSAMIKSLIGQGHTRARLELLPNAEGSPFNRPEWAYWLSESLDTPGKRE